MKKVVVLGGGVAGMSASHELIERGYEVEVYDKNPMYVGGKARSIEYLGDLRNPFQNPLPGEHGFRFFPGFYKHVIDTMKRIPFKTDKGKKSTVFNNLTPTSRIMIARYGKEPIVTLASFPKSKSDFEVILKDMHGTDTGLTKEEEIFFAEKIWQLITSCTERRNNDYERLGWWQYLEADRFSNPDGSLSPYQSLLVQGLTRTLVAAQAKSASTKTGGNTFLQLIFGMMDPTEDVDRVLNGPTNERWLYAWHDYLNESGVQYHKGWEVKEIKCDDNKQVKSATVRNFKGEEKIITADYFILAIPIEQAAKLITQEIIAADNTLKYINDLAPSVSWMNGIQYYLTEDVVISEGHIIYSDSEWAITSISQVQFWKNYDITSKGNGNIKGVLSVDISDWFSPGRYTTTKCADECTRDEVANEVWEQIKNSLNVNGNVILRDDMRVDYYLDRDIHVNLSVKSTDANFLSNREPLLVNSVNTWNLRPDASCDIKNLFFASDYVRTFTDLATMEGANEAARRAVNCLLDVDKSSASKCKIWPLQEPRMYSPLKWYDKKRWDRGLPWSLKLPWWMKAFMFVWVPLCLIGKFFQFIGKKILSIFK